MNIRKVPKIGIVENYCIGTVFEIQVLCSKLCSIKLWEWTVGERGSWMARALKGEVLDLVRVRHELQSRMVLLSRGNVFP